MENEYPRLKDPLADYFKDNSAKIKKTFAKEILVLFVSIGATILFSTFLCLTQKKISEELILDATAVVFVIAYPCRLIYKLIKWSIKNLK